MTEITNLEKIGSKDLIVFDLDGTLARTKTAMDSEMKDLVTKLLSVKKMAVIGGGKYEVFQMQLLNELKDIEEKLLQNLYIFPTTATAFYHYENGWQQVYALNLTEEEVKKIKDAFNRVFEEIGYKHPEQTYGEILENRGTQVSFSVFGQDLVAALGEQGIKMKEEWKEKNTPLKMQIAELVQKYLPEFEVRAAGFTTIDVTKKGIDKSYGIHQIKEHLKIPVEKMLFIGDAIFPGGNDHAVVKTGVDYIPVKDPEETKKIIRKLI
jgi:phosphomannomutase